VRYNAQGLGGLFLEHLNTILAENLKKLREEKKLSLDKVAKLTGVSKSMLGQIERGDTNPTISTVWKIANGMKISFTALLNQEQSDTQLIRKKEVEPIVEDNGKLSNYIYFPYEDDKKFEIYKIVMKKGAYLDAEPHMDGTFEYVTIFQGELTIRVGDEEYTLKEGDALKFRADQSHSYHNSGSGEMKASEILYYS